MMPMTMLRMRKKPPHLIFAFHSHITSSKAVLASSLSLLFKKTRRLALELHCLSGLVEANVDVPVSANYLLLATFIPPLRGCLGIPLRGCLGVPGISLSIPSHPSLRLA